ncbi:Predicted 5' DNA nuclease, flap endonuclease-1-like, helix-3-turn-helix (H3TH) domain [Sphingobium faniae]|nr:Predicted 5' DNA nuclease, flap endonuclease-1-like, helix-3-turn-helix (H3TH) domain [Sphingobium faniae]
MAFTLNEIALLAIALIAGLILGLMISGRGKYKRLWRDEQIGHRHSLQDRDQRLQAANERIAELERQSGPIGPGTASAVAGAVHGRDDLTMISGVTLQDEISLNEAGYHRYSQIAALSAEQQATLEGRLGRSPGTIHREEWPEQAQLLKDGKLDEHGRHYDRPAMPR